MVSRTQHTKEELMDQTREGEHYKNLKEDEKQMFEDMYD
jgi:hypothetical protein